MIDTIKKDLVYVMKFSTVIGICIRLPTENYVKKKIGHERDGNEAHVTRINKGVCFLWYQRENQHLLTDNSIFPYHDVL
jgi:hypothetical protein